MADTANSAQSGEGGTRRDFLYLTTTAMGLVGTGVAVWPLLGSLNPAADTLALLSIEVDISAIEVGQRVTVTWRGNPVFIDRRTEEQIKLAADTPLDDLPDPEADSERVQKPEWLIMVGVCTHLGCIPLGQKAGQPRGEWAGWFCPCHGSHYDTSGRIRKGPAPLNLPIPPYEFLDETLIRIG